MTRLTLDLADELSARLKERAAETGHASVEDYVQALLRSEADASDEAVEFVAPPHLVVNSDEELVEKLDEAEASGPDIEMTREEWQAVRREVLERLGAVSRDHPK